MPPELGREPVRVAKINNRQSATFEVALGPTLFNPILVKFNEFDRFATERVGRSDVAVWHLHVRSITINKTPSLVNPYGPGTSPFPYNPDPTSAVFTSGATIFGLEPGAHDVPSVQQFSLGVQQQLAADWGVEVSYVGSVGRHFPINIDANSPIYKPGGSTTTAGLNARRPYEPTPSTYTFGQITQTVLHSNFSYNALQAKLMHNFTRNFAVHATYVWSKAIALGAVVNAYDIQSSQISGYGCPSLGSRHRTVRNEQPTLGRNYNLLETRIRQVECYTAVMENRITVNIEVSRSSGGWKCRSVAPRSILVTIALALISVFAHAEINCSRPELQHQGKDIATIQRLENAWSTAFLKGDVDLEKCLLLPEFTEIFSDGSIKHLEDELELARANEGKNLSISNFPAVTVSLQGNAAAAFGAAESKGADNKRRWWFVDYYVWQGNRWHVFFAQQTSIPNQFNAEQLRLGQFHYRNVSNGADLGTSDITIRKGSQPHTFVYTNHVTGRFSQQWEAVAGTHFEPISANLSFGEGDEHHLTFELKYAAQHVTGVFLPRNSHQKLTVNKDVLPDTVDQRIDWAAAISQIILIPGHNCTFHVFDPGTGDSAVTVRIEGPETVHVPAGTFRAVRIVYQVEKSSGPETYQVLTNVTGPRMLLKEEFPNGSVMELTAVQD